jgi:pimeloyl-ACP methyl ester carboxylesterase
MELHYKQTGDGFPLIILHGLFGMLDNWYTLGKKFGTNYNTYMVDQRNHGHSPHEYVFNYDVMAGDLLNFMDEQLIESAHIIGHSMGGKTAMTFAVKFPQRVQKLVVADISPKYYPPHHQDVIEAIRSIRIDEIKSRSEADSVLKQFSLDEGTRQFLLKNLYHKEGNKFDWRFNFQAIEKQIEEVGKSLPDYYRFNNPALFIRGGNSRYVQDEDIDLIQLIFPKYELSTIEGAGHWLHAEKPEEFFTVVHKFLQS